LIEFIDATPKGEIIYVNIYEFNYMPVALALGRASQRGVRLNIMADSSKEDSWNQKKATIQYLRSEITLPSKIVMLHNDIAAGAINRHKYVVFSAVTVQGQKFNHVVFSASMNFATNQVKVLQDAVVLSDEPLYE